MVGGVALWKRSTGDGSHFNRKGGNQPPYKIFYSLSRGTNKTGHGRDEWVEASGVKTVATV